MRAINQLDELSERRNRYQHSDKKQSIHLSLLQLENKQQEEDEFLAQDMTGIVFSSRASYFETYGRTSSSMHYLLFQEQGFACCDCSF